jgi:hypothetical protein
MWWWAYKRKSKVYKLRLAMFTSIRAFHIHPGSDMLEGMH